VFVGEPGLGYPFRWAVHRWIEGDNAHHDHVDDPVGLAHDLAAFVRALRSVPTDGMPRSARGRPIADPGGEIRRRILGLADELDVDALLAAWNDAIAAPHWKGPFVPVHGDLSGNNLLLSDGRLVGVIDFSCFGVGEPANDLDVAWELFDEEARAAYREQLDADDSTWSRGRGWAIRSVYRIPYYRQTNPGIVQRAFGRLHNVINDWRATHP
jgi:aminoglycoside phosphotransferase (APT) family kinase protein